MHIKHIHETIEKIADCAKTEVCKGVENLDTKEMEEVAQFIWRVAEGDKVDTKDEVTEFMSQYRTIHYAFTEEEGYKFIEHI